VDLIFFLSITRGYASLCDAPPPGYCSFIAPALPGRFAAALRVVMSFFINFGIWGKGSRLGGQGIELQIPDFRLLEQSEIWDLQFKERNFYILSE
jgi:hypothetical protein